MSLMNIRTCEGCSCVIDTYTYKKIGKRKKGNADKLKKGEKLLADSDWWRCKNCGFTNEP